MGRWRDVSNWLSARGGYPQGHISLCCSVISQAGVSGCGLSWIFWRSREVMDLYAGVSTTPVEMMVDGKRPDFSRLVRRILEDVVMGIPQAKVP